MPEVEEMRVSIRRRVKPRTMRLNLTKRGLKPMLRKELANPIKYRTHSSAEMMESRVFRTVLAEFLVGGTTETLGSRLFEANPLGEGGFALSLPLTKC